jgi:5-methylcytosine-specific restriction endonuclease McrA
LTERRLFSARERRALAIYSGFRCEMCRARLDRFEADHVVPWSKGGKTDVRNGQALCSSCNRKKGAKQ